MQGCGTWPAFWLVGPNWPNGGEIDVSYHYLFIIIRYMYI